MMHIWISVRHLIVFGDSSKGTYSGWCLEEMKEASDDHPCPVAAYRLE